jgi:hypothetical protein
MATIPFFLGSAGTHPYDDFEVLFQGLMRRSFEGENIGSHEEWRRLANDAHEASLRILEGKLRS